jgi:hypothetical protein
MMEALSSPETSVVTRVMRRNIPEDSILHSHRREDPNSYVLYNIYEAARCRAMSYAIKYKLVPHIQESNGRNETHFITEGERTIFR